MKPSLAFLVPVLLSTVCGRSFAQSEAAMPFLLIPASPEMDGMGGVSSALVSTHPMAPVGNPAQLGHFSQENFVNAGMYLSERNPYPMSFVSDLSLSTFAVNAGINLDPYLGFPLGVGIGYSRVRFGLGKFIVTGSGGPAPIGTFETYELCDNISLGVGFSESWVEFDAGASLKLLNAHLAAVGTESEQSAGSARATAYDLGFLLRIPTVGIASEAGADLSVPSLHIEPLLDLTVGFARTNVGGGITYADPAQADPLPRQGTLGAGVEAGIVSTLVRGGWKVIAASIVREASDLLVVRHSDGTWEYKGWTGGIRFVDDVILGKTAAGVTQRKGWQVEVAEFFSLRGGSVAGPFSDYTTGGFGVRLGGLLKFFSAIGVEESAPVLAYLRENVDVRFDQSKEEYGPGLFNPAPSATYSSLGLTIRKLPF